MMKTECSKQTCVWQTDGHTECLELLSEPKLQLFQLGITTKDTSLILCVSCVLYLNYLLPFRTQTWSEKCQLPPCSCSRPRSPSSSWARATPPSPCTQPASPDAPSPAPAMRRYWPMRAQYSDHVTWIDQWRVSIQVTWSVLTNHRLVFRSRELKICLTDLQRPSLGS